MEKMRVNYKNEPDDPGAVIDGNHGLISKDDGRHDVKQSMEKAGI